MNRIQVERYVCAECQSDFSTAAECENHERECIAEMEAHAAHVANDLVILLRDCVKPERRHRIFLTLHEAFDLTTGHRRRDDGSVDYNG